MVFGEGEEGIIHFKRVEPSTEISTVTHWDTMKFGYVRRVHRDR